MRYVAHTETHKGLTINIVPDSDPESPREWDNLGTMVCWHNRYRLGDDQPDCSPLLYQMQMAALALSDGGRADGDYRLACLYRQPGESWEDCAYTRDIELEFRIGSNPDKLNRVLESHYLMLPLYLYDHSGITMRCSAFSCPWDSGQVGFIFVSKADARKEFGRLTKATVARIEQSLRGEVETYAQYLEGDVYGYEVEDSDGETLDSCWGFYGIEDCLSEARNSADYHAGKRDESLAREWEASRPDMYGEIRA